MDQLTSPVATASPPGWYTDPCLPGCVRWWDGAGWSAHVAAPAGGFQDDRSMAVFAHLLGFLTGFLGPLVVYLVARPDQRFLRHHAAEALNFHITAMVAALVVSVLWVTGFFLSLVSGYFGLLLLLMPVLLILVVVFPVIGAIAARRGEWFRYGPVFHLFSAD